MTALPGVKVSPPPPLIWLATVVMTPLESIVPPPAPRVMLRVAPSVVAEVTCSVPPLKLRPPPAAPRLESDEIDSVTAVDRPGRGGGGGVGERPRAGAGLLEAAETLVLRAAADLADVEARIGAAAKLQLRGAPRRHDIAGDARVRLQL